MPRGIEGGNNTLVGGGRGREGGRGRTSIDTTLYRGPRLYRRARRGGGYIRYHYLFNLLYKYLLLF